MNYTNYTTLTPRFSIYQLAQAPAERIHGQRCDLLALAESRGQPTADVDERALDMPGPIKRTRTNGEPGILSAKNILKLNIKTGWRVQIKGNVDRFTPKLVQAQSLASHTRAMTRAL